jgi:hypothetical protein
MYNDIFVWTAVIMDNDERINEFEALMNNTYKIRVKFLEQIITQPGINHLHQKHNGGRQDMIFSVHEDDIPALKNFIHIMERIDNELLIMEWNLYCTYSGQYMYPQHILDKYPFKHVDFPSIEKIPDELDMIMVTSNALMVMEQDLDLFEMAGLGDDVINPNIFNLN